MDTEPMPNSPESMTAAPQPGEEYVRRHEAQLQRVRRRPIDLLFIGDAVAGAWARAGEDTLQNNRAVWNEYYEDRRAVASGLSGDGPQNLLWRIENGLLDGLMPCVAVLTLGLGAELQRNRPALETARGIERVVAEVQSRLPGTQIVVLGLPPTGHEERERTSRKINAWLQRRYMVDSGVEFVDAGDALRRDGEADPGLYDEAQMDPPRSAVNPNAAGLRRIAEALEPTLASLLGERSDPHRPTAPSRTEHAVPEHQPAPEPASAPPSFARAEAPLQPEQLLQSGPGLAAPAPTPEKRGFRPWSLLGSS